MIFNRQVKYLFEQVLHNWHSLTDAEEIEIIRKYANKGRLITISGGRKNKIRIMRICKYLTLFFYYNLKKYIASCYYYISQYYQSGLFIIVYFLI